MSNENITPYHLTWEWPADRAVERVLVISITKMKQFEQGLFGLKASPSIGSSLPNPIKLEGEIISNNSSHQIIEIVLPSVEIENISVSDTIKIGLLKEDIVVCIKKIEGDIDNAVITKVLAELNCD